MDGIVHRLILSDSTKVPLLPIVMGKGCRECVLELGSALKHTLTILSLVNTDTNLDLTLEPSTADLALSILLFLGKDVSFLCVLYAREQIALTMTSSPHRAWVAFLNHRGHLLPIALVTADENIEHTLISHTFIVESSTEEHLHAGQVIYFMYDDGQLVTCTVDS